jgi:hypothetical protein
MTKATIYQILKGKSYYNGVSALGIQGLRIHSISDVNHVKSVVVGNNRFIWCIYYCAGLHGKPAWTVNEQLEIE